MYERIRMYDMVHNKTLQEVWRKYYIFTAVTICSL